MLNDSKQSTGLALITGASQRIGKALAEHLTAKGWNIAIHYNQSEQSALALRDQLRHSFPEQCFEIFKADFLLLSEIMDLIPSVIHRMGIPELLINNASLFEPSGIADTSPELFDQQFMVNFKVPFFLIQSYARFCEHGQVINLADTRITDHSFSHAAYTLSKKAIWELTKMAALEFGPNIRVNALAPGLILPPAGKDESYLDNLAGDIPLKRAGGLLPVLKSIDFLIENDYTTGQLIFCDGGQNLL